MFIASASPALLTPCEGAEVKLSGTVPVSFRPSHGVRVLDALTVLYTCHPYGVKPRVFASTSIATTFFDRPLENWGYESDSILRRNFRDTTLATSSVMPLVVERPLSKNRDGLV